MSKLQMLKKALISYVANSIKAVWSTITYPLVIEGKKNCNLADYRIYGNSVQDGEPTPEAPIEIRSVGELTTKNLLDVNKVYLDYANDEGGITYDVDDLQKVYAINMFEEWKENTRYTFSASYEINADDNRVNLYVVYTDGTIEGFWTELGGKFTGYKRGYGSMTTKAEKTVQKMVLAYSAGSKALDVKLTNMQLEEGATATEYEPYQKYKIPVCVSSENLLDLSLISDSSPITQKYGDYGIKQIRTSNNNVGFKFPVDIKVGSTIYLSYEFVEGGGDFNSVYLRAYPSNGDSRYGIYTGQSSYTIGKRYVRKINITKDINGLEFYTQYAWGAGSYYIIDNVKITYTQPEYYNIFVDEPLRKIEEFEDCVDFKKGVVVRNIGKRIFDGTESWSHEVMSSKYNNFYTKMTDAYPDRYTSLFCNMGEYYADGNLTSDYAIRISSSKNFNFRYQDCDNAQSFANKLTELYNNGNPLYAIYRLNALKEESIILPKIPQLKGTTLYTVETTVKSSGIEVCYYE